MVLLATRVPDAYEDKADLSDPPRSWGEAAGTVAWAGGMTLLVFTAVVVALALATVAIGRRPPPLRTLAISAVTPPAIIVALLVLLLAVNSGKARLAVDCDSFRFDRAALESTDPERWQRQAFGLRDCKTLDEQSRTRIQELLGAPDRQILSGERWFYKDDQLSVIFSGDGVDRVYVNIDD